MGDEADEELRRKLAWREPENGPSEPSGSRDLELGEEVLEELEPPWLEEWLEEE